jgi:hypothetical protein
MDKTSLTGSSACGRRVVLSRGAATGRTRHARRWVDDPDPSQVGRVDLGNRGRVGQAGGRDVGGGAGRVGACKATTLYP